MAVRSIDHCQKLALASRERTVHERPCLPCHCTNDKDKFGFLAILLHLTNAPDCERMRLEPELWEGKEDVLASVPSHSTFERDTERVPADDLYNSFRRLWAKEDVVENIASSPEQSVEYPESPYWPDVGRHTYRGDMDVGGDKKDPTLHASAAII